MNLRELKFSHYSYKEIKTLDIIVYPQKIPSFKPRGLWVSVDGKYDWLWCRVSERFSLEALTHKHSLTFKHDANILILNTPGQVCNLIKDHKINPKYNTNSYITDWSKLIKKYQGMIIAPYQWDCRFHDSCSWYYSWDCASGVIWDLNCIEDFRLEAVARLEDLEGAANSQTFDPTLLHHYQAESART